MLIPWFQKFGGNQSKPEFTVDLRGGSVDWASKDKSSKKHVIEVQYLLSSVDPPSLEAWCWSGRVTRTFPSHQLKTRQGTELLIQSEIDSVINDWFRALTETINTHVRGHFYVYFHPRCDFLSPASCTVWTRWMCLSSRPGLGVGRGHWGGHAWVSWIWETGQGERPAGL